MSARSRAVGLRGRLLLSAVGAIAVVLVGLMVAFNLLLRDRLDREATGVAQARAAAEVASLRVAHGRILLPEAPDDLSPDIQTWVFQAGRVLEHPRTSRANDLAAATLAPRAPATADVSRTNTRLYALPVVADGRTLGAVVAGASLAPYQQTARTAIVASGIFALAVLLAFALAARWLIDRALRPVGRMTRQARDWSEHDLDRRFALGPPTDEITELASTLDELLERLGTSLRHEQRLSAEISHELRTPLANIVAEAQYALRHGPQTGEVMVTLEHILRSADRLGRTLDTLMAAARAQLDPRGASSDAVACARAASEAAAAHHATPGVEMTVDADDGPIRTAVEPELVQRILAPLLDNAARHARTSVHVAITREQDHVQFIVADDGPGVTEDREAIFEPGHRATANGATATIASHHAGLGLALCRRLARTAGGDVHAEPSDAGARFVVRLPAA